MREKFTLPEAKLHYFVVDWSADALSWEDFRGKVRFSAFVGRVLHGIV